MKTQKILCLLSLVFLLAGCFEEKKPTVYKRGAPYSGPQLIAENIEVFMSDSARPSMKMKAKKQIILQNEDQDFPLDFYVEFYNEKGVVYSKLKSNKAFLNKAKNEWKLTGDVYVDNFEKGQKLETEEMFWNLDTGDILVETKHKVKITEPGQVLNGQGLKAKDDFSYYKITKPTAISFL
jgi:LPS export ABC transporter protein LptC